MSYGAVIAAAGFSSRMGEFKPLLPLGGQTMIAVLIGRLRAAGVEEILVVTGHNGDRLEAHLAELGVNFVRNPDYASTQMFESICLGLRGLRGCHDGVFITPGDVPLVRPETIREMEQRAAAVVRPVYGGRQGHPVLLSAEVVPQVLRYDGTDGLRRVLRQLNDRTVRVEVPDEGVLLDADTPEEFQTLLRREAAGNQARPGAAAQEARA